MAVSLSAQPVVTDAGTAKVLLVEAGTLSLIDPTNLPGVGGGGLTNFTDTANTAAPNATVAVSVLTAVAATTDADFAIKAKGTGAILAHVPDSTTTGGNKRAAGAVDLQMSRSTAAQVASGSRSVVGGGMNNTASGSQSAVSGGTGNTASGSYSTVAGGSGNSASAEGAAVLGGGGNLASGAFSTASGFNASARGIQGARAHSPGLNGSAGSTQALNVTLFGTTSGTTPKVLTASGSAASATTTYSLTNNRAALITGRVVAQRLFSTNETSAWTFSAAIRRGANAASTALVAAVTPVLVAQDAGAAPWVLTVTANTTIGGLEVTLTGATGHTVTATCELSGVEVQT